MKNKLLRILCMLLAVPVVFTGSVSAASGARSDTTGNFTVPQGGTYTFKITSSGRPSLAAGSKSFRYVSTRQSGSNYFIKFSAVGKVGDGCGFYLNGIKRPVAVATIHADVPRSDTTGNFTVPQGGTYTFKITSSGRPSLAAGSKSFRYVSTRQSGSNYFIKFSAVGKAGEGCGFYLNGVKVPVAVANIVEAVQKPQTTKAFTTIQTGTFIVEVPGDWDISTNPEVIFKKKDQAIGGVSEINYDSTRPLSQFYGNHAEEIRKKEIKNFSLPATEVVLRRSSPAASGQLSSDELHYYFTPKGGGVAYDLNFNSNFVDHDIAEKIAQSFKIR